MAWISFKYGFAAGISWRGIAIAYVLYNRHVNGRAFGIGKRAWFGAYNQPMVRVS